MVNKINSDRYTWGNNCTAWVLQDDDQLSVKQELMPPGTREILHYHQNATQFFYVLNGEATIHLEQELIILKSNEGLTVPKLKRHFISNESSVDLEFLVISQPSTNNDRINV